MAVPVRTRLKSARLRQGMTMREVAERAGVSRTVIQTWEARTHVPRGDHALRVADVMGLDMEDLFHDFGITRVPREEVRLKSHT